MIVSFFAALSLLMFSVVNLFFLPRLKRIGEVPQLAVCIPLRNEERHVEKLISSLRAALPEGATVYLYEDRSTDRTRELLQALTRTDTRFRIIDGLPLPAGWAGKVHACHQLSRQTTEPYLLFLDADVTLSQDTISRLFAKMQEEKAVFLSGFPSFPVETFLGKLLIPMQHVLIAQHLPLFFRKVRHPAFAAANGMVVLVEREAYENIGGHKAIRDAIVDDLALCRLFKQNRYITTLVHVAPFVSCDMYATNREVWLGFNKNIFRGMNDSYLLGSYFLLYYGYQAMTLPFAILFPSAWSLGALSFVLLARLRIDRVARMKGAWLLHPLACLVYCLLLLTAMTRSLRKGTIEWKGRTYT
ncbi:glycosyltransferase [Exiguobacterium flavidum]|uniref:glycosyltransferase n=1 Tax=Exiguobacterium flavidum TaxID=2184695 RepID=UPI000DF849E4|nr:glycosyltransferase family 2 protein [Exiguobacterium flavidum]